MATADKELEGLAGTGAKMGVVAWGRCRLCQSRRFGCGRVYRVYGH